ncbi:MAG: electron transporter SenC [Opitutus sp.]|nr:electron transporter SenC [Opitutus sp.]
MSLRYSRPIVLAAVALMSAFAGGGCSRDANASSSASGPANPDEKRYPLTGEIVSADLERKVLIVTHDEIKDYMPAMTMEFLVSKADAANARTGQRIRAELVERKGEYFLEKIWPDDSLTVRALDASAKALAQDTATRGRGVYREVGEAAPDFTLLDQEGRAIAASKFRGKKVMMNFIFTRCPIATMCPAATQKMAGLQQAAKEAGVTDVEFVSVSLDPEYDTPGVLKEYAELRGLDLSNWSFLTGPDAAVRHLLAQMGIIREFEGATIKHNLATLLIDPSGRIIHRVDGSRWDTQEFLPKMKR